MLFENQHPKNRHIMCSVLGKPNAGKSTLINHLLGYDLTIVSPKPQTTRNQFHCVFTVDHTEVILVDTPGLHQAQQELNIRMNNQAHLASEGVDVHLILIDAQTPDWVQEYKEIHRLMNGVLEKMWVIFTKSDRLSGKEEDKKERLELFKKRAQELPGSLERVFLISAQEGTNIHELTGALVDAANPGPHLYPDGSVSNKNMRFFVSEYIREQAFKLLKEELPYELAVIIEEYKEIPLKEDNSGVGAHISASLLVNRPSQRGIVVGKGGAIIKQIGVEARKKIEALLGAQVHLNLHVKVSPKWFSNNWVLDEIGLPRSQTSARVWRQK